MLTLVSNPPVAGNPEVNPRRRRRHPTARRRNPAEVNPRHHYRHHPTARRRNPAEANPHHHYRHHRRNPFGIDEGLEKAYGVGLEQIGGGVAGFTLTEVVGQKVDQLLQGSLPAPTRPADNVVDLGYALRRTLPRAIAGGLTYWASRLLKLEKKVTDAVGVGAGASVASQFLASSHVLPSVWSDGSLLIGHNPIPVPPPMAGALPAPSEAPTRVPVMSAF